MNDIVDWAVETGRIAIHRRVLYLDMMPSDPETTFWMLCRLQPGSAWPISWLRS